MIFLKVVRGIDISWPLWLMLIRDVLFPLQLDRCLGPSQMQTPKLAMATVMRLFLVGLSIALAEDVPLLRGSNLTKPSNLTKAVSSGAEDVTKPSNLTQAASTGAEDVTKPSNLTKSAGSGRIIGKDVLYDKIMGYWVPLSAFDAPSQHSVHCYHH